MTLLPLCGQNSLGPPASAGCGEKFHAAEDVYRCTDCGVPFHRTCALTHFEQSAAAPIVVNWRLSCIVAEERGDKLLALARRLRQALGGRGIDDGCDCSRCSALRAFDRFITAARDARSGSPRIAAQGGGLDSPAAGEVGPPAPGSLGGAG